MLEATNLKVGQLFSKYIRRKKVTRGMFYCSGRPNIGDSVVPFLVENVGGVSLPYANPKECSGRILFSIGSVLQWATIDVDVWGSGFISATSRLRYPPNEVLAVRGPLSAAMLSRDVNVECDVYGDPAILLPLYCVPVGHKVLGRIGLIPHYVDKDKLLKADIARHNDAIVIDVETSDIQSFVNQVASCELIVSSSLHGVIIAEAYNIPAIWAEFDDEVVGNGFKFYDYYASTEREISPLSFYDITQKDLVARSGWAIPNMQNSASELLAKFPSTYCG